MSLHKRIKDSIATAKHIHKNKERIKSITIILERNGFSNIRLLKKHNMIYRNDNRFYFSAKLNDTAVFVKTSNDRLDKEIERSTALSNMGIDVPAYVYDGVINDNFYYVVYEYLRKWHDIASLNRFFFLNKDIKNFCDWLLKNLNILESNNMLINDFNGGGVMFKRSGTNIVYSFVDYESFSLITDSKKLQDNYSKIAVAITRLFRRKKHFINSIKSFKIIKTRGYESL